MKKKIEIENQAACGIIDLRRDNGFKIIYP